MELPYPEQVLCFEGLLFMYNDWVLVSKIFYFHLYLGKRSNLTIVFQMGWIHPSWFVFLKHILAQNTSQYLRFGLPNGSFTGLRTGCPRKEGAKVLILNPFKPSTRKGSLFAAARPQATSGNFVWDLSHSQKAKPGRYGWCEKTRRGLLHGTPTPIHFGTPKTRVQVEVFFFKTIFMFSRSLFFQPMAGW